MSVNVCVSVLCLPGCTSINGPPSIVKYRVVHTVGNATIGEIAVVDQYARHDCKSFVQC